MTRTAHHFAHSRGLQLAALLAWLFLVVTPVFGMHSGAHGGTHDSHHTTSMQNSAHGDHATQVDMDRSCCGSHDAGCAGHACDCATVCGTIAVLPVIRDLASLRAADAHSSALHARVPGSDSTPPLRPPAA